MNTSVYKPVSVYFNNVGVSYDSQALCGIAPSHHRPWRCPGSNSPDRPAAAHRSRGCTWPTPPGWGAAASSTRTHRSHSPTFWSISPHLLGRQSEIIRPLWTLKAYNDTILNTFSLVHFSDLSNRLDSLVVKAFPCHVESPRLIPSMCTESILGVSFCTMTGDLVDLIGFVIILLSLSLFPPCVV